MANRNASGAVKVFESAIETVLFNSRWLLAPFYIGLIAALVMLLISFVRQLVAAVPRAMSMGTEDVILAVLSLIDMSLAANLVLIVIFSGYENFVSKINTGDSEDRPSWMGTLDFSGLKMKLIGSIVAISAISLLRAFMDVTRPNAVLDNAKLAWLVGLHLTFIISGVLFALMDWLASLTEKRLEGDAHPGPVAP